MRRTSLTFGQNGDEVKPLTTNEIKPLSEDERRTRSLLGLPCGRQKVISKVTTALNICRVLKTTEMGMASG